MLLRNSAWHLRPQVGCGAVAVASSERAVADGFECADRLASLQRQVDMVLTTQLENDKVQRRLIDSMFYDLAANISEGDGRIRGEREHEFLERALRREDGRRKKEGEQEDKKSANMEIENSAENTIPPAPSGARANPTASSSTVVATTVVGAAKRDLGDVVQGERKNQRN